MNLVVVLCYFLLGVDATAWAVEAGWPAGCVWLLGIGIVWVYNRWKQQADSRIPTPYEVQQRRRRRLAS